MSVGPSSPSPTMSTLAGASASAYSSWKTTCSSTLRSPGQPRQVHPWAARCRCHRSRPSNASCSRPGPPRPRSSANSPTRLADNHSRTSRRKDSMRHTLTYQALALEGLMAGDPSRQTVSAVLDRAAALFGDAEALVDGEVRLTYTALRAQVHTAARALIGMGVQPGDRVALCAPNSRHWVVAALGALHAGAALVPINTRFTATETLDVLQRSKARAFLVEGSFLGRDRLAELQGEELPEIIVRIPVEWLDWATN